MGFGTGTSAPPLGSVALEYSAVSLSMPTSSTTSPCSSAGSFERTHVRRRSSCDMKNEVAISLGDPHADQYGGRSLLEKSKIGATDPLNMIGSGADRKYAAWRDGKVLGRRRGSKRCFALLALVLVCLGGWLSGSAAGNAVLSRQAERQRSWLAAVSRQSVPTRCNPYEQLGILNVNTSEPSGNAWQPLGAGPDCQPVDYMSELRQVIVEGKTSPVIDFVRNRTIVLFGDSVDRDHNDHFCGFLSGRHEMISSDHPLSPPQPEGEELPPEGYKNAFTGRREWPDNLQSRPWVCHIDSLGLRILNVFHYGFQSRDFDNGYIATHAHFYPPATVEERFDQIVMPIVKGLAEQYGASPVPDLFSIAPGFWSQLRQGVADVSAYSNAVEKGMNPDEAGKVFDVWRSMEPAEQKWFEGRMYDTIRHIARAWPEGKDGQGSYRPTLLWRALHTIKETNVAPVTRTVAADQIGRMVVKNLVEESRAAAAGAATWKAWSKQIGAKALGWTRESKAAALEDDLQHRLRIDEWGARMIGQTRYFHDLVHPLPLPGSWLYGNMLMHQLRVRVDQEGSR
ncbi:uncharacterized protein JCM15063_001497 [Sporobolomyces koalae]|uniref:uncharacterized protein n=1 Tax=Sporobolomyces koalae TaxID=500713 RepID=UPI003180B33F